MEIDMNLLFFSSIWTSKAIHPNALNSQNWKLNSEYRQIKGSEQKAALVILLLKTQSNMNHYALR